MRGGYKSINEPTIISNRGTPMFTVYPAVNNLNRDQAKRLVETNRKDWGKAWEEADDQ